MRANEFLTELFNRPYPVRIFADQAVAKDSQGQPIYVEFDRNPSWETVRVSFDRGDKSNNRYELTGTGDEMRVFATVVAAIREWAAQYEPGMLYFSTENNEPTNRRRLYQRMVRELISGTNYQQVSQADADRITDERVNYWVEKLPTRFQGGTFFFLVRRDLLEPVTEANNTDTPARQWIDKIYDRFYEHPFNHRHRVMVWGEGDDQELGIFELGPVPGKPTTVDIKWFQAFPQRQGIGRRAMQILQQLAQADGITLTLYPWNRGEISQSKLTKIYRGMGFQPTTRGSKDLTWSPDEVKESLDQPYPITWVGMLSGVYDAVATLPDGSSLRIIFNDGGVDDWEVDFMRDARHSITGQGDAQRVFATVMMAIQQFIKKQDPWQITFSANKEGYADSGSRVKLYNRMVERYARAWGYETYQEDHGDKVVYELTRQGERLDEGDVIRNKFAIKQAQKARTPYRRNPDIEIPQYDPSRGTVYHPALAQGQPEAFSHFEAEAASPRVFRIIGITQQGQRVTVSTTGSEELARVLADAYNRGGFTSADIQRVPLGDLDEGWRDWAGAAALTGALAAGGAAVYDRAKPKPAPAPLPVAVQQQPTALVTGSPHERFLTKMARSAGIEGAELAQFLAQLAHETGDFVNVLERGRDFRRYEPKFSRDRKTGRMVNVNDLARRLGNDRVGDGERFKGRGYIQLTGRYNYRRAGEALGMDLENNPKLAAKPAVAARIALWYWKNRVASAVQDFTDTAAVTRRINPAMRGLEDRQVKFDQYQRVHAAPARHTNENFADGKIRGKSRPGRVKRSGASCKGSVTDLRARARKYGGERGRMYHWCANMKSGKKK